MNDFLCFDGNVQGFRILTKLASWRNDGGMQVTYAVLGAFSKYPHPSSAIPPGGKKKFGFMHAERDIATKVYTQLGLRNPRGGYLRHPLAYIVEAADDICYLTADVDDAHRMERLSTSAAEALLEPIGRLGGTIGRYGSIPVVEERDRISYLRSGAAAALIKEAIKQFYDREDSLLRGNVIESLLNVSVNYSRHIREITDKCRQLVYTERSKLQTEAAGYNVIKGLLDHFGGMVQQLIKQGSVNDLNPKDKGLYDLLPKEFRDRLLPGDPYECLLVLVDYVSGMTDRFALDLYQRLTGTSVVLGRMA
jgi:dGTPase